MAVEREEDFFQVASSDLTFNTPSLLFMLQLADILVTCNPMYGLGLDGSPTH